jgi:hypothetical protein
MASTSRAKSAIPLQNSTAISGVNNDTTQRAQVLWSTLARHASKCWIGSMFRPRSALSYLRGPMLQSETRRAVAPERQDGSPNPSPSLPRARSRLEARPEGLLNNQLSNARPCLRYDASMSTTSCAVVSGLMACWLMCGCGSSARDGDLESPETVANPGLDDGDGSEASSSDTASPDDVRAHQMLGVKLFWNAATDYDQALWIGPAEIVNDCLLVGGSVVIWHESRLGYAENAVGTLKAGGAITLSVGGSGASAPHPVVSMNCAGFPIWFGSPDAT